MRPTTRRSPPTSTPQWLKSYCGVASSVVVLTAMGADVTRQNVFTAEAQSVQPRWRIVVAGMALDELGSLLAAHGAFVSVRHADAFDVEAFRKVVAGNLSATRRLPDRQLRPEGARPGGRRTHLAARGL